MHEIRIHGRGGQGGVTTGQLLAVAAFHDGMFCQTFPMFGVERAGAPVAAFARVDKKPIMIRSEIYNPDIEVVLDSSLLQTVDVTSGLKKKGNLIINSNKDIKDLGVPKGYKVHVVDATQIAMSIFHRAIVNTPMLGAFAKITGIVTLRSLKKAVDEVLLPTKGPRLADLNKKAIEAVYKATK